MHGLPYLALCVAVQPLSRGLPASTALSLAKLCFSLVRTTLNCLTCCVAARHLIPNVRLSAIEAEAIERPVQPLTRLLLAEAIISSLDRDATTILRLVSQIRIGSLAARAFADLDAATELHLLANAVELGSADSPDSDAPAHLNIDVSAEALGLLSVRTILELVKAGLISDDLVQRVARVKQRLSNNLDPENRSI